jgi:2-haloacid dehalogenase
MSFVRHRVKTVALGFPETLADEREGLRRTLVEVLGPARVHVDPDAMAEALARDLRTRYAGSYREFPVHLLASLEAVCAAHGQSLGVYDEDDVDLFVQRWPLVEDHYALARLGQRYKLALLAQLDKASLAGCLPSLARQPDFVVTSDLSRTYKPAPGYFKLLRVQLRLSEPDELLVISAEKDTDLAPAEACGYQTLWIDPTGESGGPTSLTEAIKLLS